MAITAAEIEALADAAVTAIGAGDNATALVKLRQAKALLSVLPDSEKDGNVLNWDRAALDTLITEIKGEVSAAATSTAAAGDGAGMQRTKIIHKRADGLNWDWV